MFRRLVRGAADMLGVGRAADAQTTQRFDQNQAHMGVNLGELGSSRVVQNPDGSWSKTVDMGAADTQRNQLISQMLGDIDPTGQGAQDAFFNAQMRMATPHFEQARRDLDTNLINRGIQVGTGQHNEAMGNLLEQQNLAKMNAADQAMFAGQQFGQGQIAKANQLAGGRDINTLLNLMGENTAYARAHEADSQRAAEAQAHRNQRSSNILGFMGF